MRGTCEQVLGPESIPVIVALAAQQRIEGKLFYFRSSHPYAYVRIAFNFCLFRSYKTNTFYRRRTDCEWEERYLNSLIFSRESCSRDSRNDSAVLIVVTGS